MKQLFFVLFFIFGSFSIQVGPQILNSIAGENTDEREGYRKTVRDNLSHFGECLKLSKNEKLKSKKIIVQWQVDDQGVVRFSKTKESSFKNKAVDNCVAAKIKTLAFPPAKEGQLVNITYTIDLNSLPKK